MTNEDSVKLLKDMLVNTIQTTINELGFMPNNCGDTVKKILSNDDTVRIIALGCMLDDCRKIGSYDGLYGMLSSLKD